MQVDNLHAICDDLLYYNILQKRKVIFDELSDGLEVFHLWAAMNAFPTLFEPLFVASATVTPEDVLQIINFKRPMDSRQELVAGYLNNVVKKLGEQGEQVKSILCVCE